MIEETVYIYHFMINLTRPEISHVSMHLFTRPGYQIFPTHLQYFEKETWIHSMCQMIYSATLISVYKDSKASSVEFSS